MTENATTDADTPAASEPTAAPAVDARTNDAIPEPAPEGAELQEQIAERAAHISEPPAEPKPEIEPATPAAPTGYEGVADPFAAHALPTHVAPTEETPDEDESPKPAKKARAKTSKAAATESTDAVEPDEALDATVTPTEEPVEAKPENKKKWYAIKVQSGREDTIKAAILRKVAIEGLEDVFGQIMIPFEKVIEKKTVKVKDKKTGESTYQEKKVERKVKKFQGYLFAELEFNDRILYLFRETSGVGDFLNLRGTPPVPEPMSDTEVSQMLTGEKPGREGGKKVVKLEFEKGDRVRIKEGSFANSEGEVKDITIPKDPTDAPKITVVVTFWGRPLDVELEYWQVTKV